MTVKENKIEKGTIIAVSGKGGTGKTVFSTMMIKLLSKDSENILAIDADPATSLPPALGISARRTIGDLREELVQGPSQAPSYNAPPDIIIDYKIKEMLVRTPKLSILAIGRPEGPGCYCLVNDILRHAIETISNNFDLTIIDCEAGLEHLSRRTTRSVDIMVIVTDPTHRGLETAKLIKSLAEKLEINFKRICLVLNRADNDIEEEFQRKTQEIGVELLGIIPEDSNITQYDRGGKPLIELPEDSPAILATRNILNKLEIPI
jgi:CO dehydrogenase maturation factor